MKEQLKEFEIPFGAKDSELCGWKYTIPEGMEATIVIVDNKIVVKKKESWDEKVRKWLIEMVEEVRKANPTNAEHNGMCSEAIAWIEKQGEKNSALHIPKFKVGDVMRTLQEAADNIIDGLPVVVSIDDKYYRCNNEIIDIKDQDNYEYPPMNRKHDICDSCDEQKPVNIDYISGIREKLLDIENNAENIVGLTESQWVAIRAAHRLLGEYIAKEQNPAWKPSGAQMKQLGWIAEQNKDNMIGKELMTLYNDLKKLRGE